ncbi:hypothetical protein Mgra_00002133 [Meloidogyne graminicola]|uniref:Uncharacterized protein n=1 Tax=Meloidogyne graminicola TaxID=189291 RepID=A0A8S9ZZL3_9BILA|nr:hypothetical protein Mgra_00002133 [Meloidogyne graminicola]
MLLNVKKTMPEEEENVNSSEEEEEEDEPVPVRQQQVRMVVTDSSSGYNQESISDSPLAKTSPQAIVTTTSTTTKVSGNEDLAEAQEAAIEAARKRHQEAIEKTRAEAVKMQEEARARAEAARQQQQQQILEQQKIAEEEQRQKQIKAQQEAAKLQAEQRAAQLKSQQEAQKQPKPVQPKAPITPQQKTVAQPQASQKAAAPIQSKSIPPTSPIKLTNNPSSQIRQPPPLVKDPEPLEPPKQILTHAPFQPKNPKTENHSWPPPSEEEDQTVESGKRNKILEDNSWQFQKRIQLEYQPIQPTKIQPPELDFDGEIKKTIVPQPAGFSKIQWNEFPEEEQKEKQSVPRVKAQDWIPENDSEHPVLKTIYQPGRIAPNPQSGRLWPPPGYGEEEQIEIGHANKVKTVGDDDWKQQGEQQELGEENVGNAPWNRQTNGGNVKNVQWPPPENQLEHGEFGRGKLNVQWPPSEQEEQEQKQKILFNIYAEGISSPWGHKVAVGNVKNTQWPPEENISEHGIGPGGRLQVQWPPGEEEEINGLQAEGRLQAAGSNVRGMQWPPPENILEHEAYGAGRMQVQWPPSEQEEREIHQVEILQTHLPTKPHQREWPPAHYVAAQGGEHNEMTESKIKEFKCEEYLNTL